MVYTGSMIEMKMIGCLKKDCIFFFLLSISSTTLNLNVLVEINHTNFSTGNCARSLRSKREKPNDCFSNKCMKIIEIIHNKWGNNNLVSLLSFDDQKLRHANFLL